MCAPNSNHLEKTAIVCSHSLHSSAPLHTLQCPTCTISAAQNDVERARKRFDNEGGANASAYMRDRAWNVERLRYYATERRVKKTMSRDWQRQERERRWDEEHALYLSQHGHIRSDAEAQSPCIVCATLAKQSQQYAKPIVSLTTAWWEREGALVEEEVVVPETPPRSPVETPRRPQSQPRLDKPSCLAAPIKKWRSMRSVADEQRRLWEDRYKLDRAIRQKYDLPDDYDIEPELFANPLPASHARYHHRRLQNYEHAAERRANRNKRRAEDYRPSRSSLALSELANAVEMDEAESERVRLEEEERELRRVMKVVASEVGYLFFVGEMGLLERWRDDFERSSVDLVQRQTQNGVYVEEDVGEDEDMML